MSLLRTGETADERSGADASASRVTRIANDHRATMVMM
jgi:hypothetical protein